MSFQSTKYSASPTPGLRVTAGYTVAGNPPPETMTSSESSGRALFATACERPAVLLVKSSNSVRSSSTLEWTATAHGRAGGASE